jgi:hypothetical protein
MTCKLTGENEGKRHDCSKFRENNFIGNYSKLLTFISNERNENIVM